MGIKKWVNLAQNKEKEKQKKFKKIPSLAQHDNFDQRAKFSYIGFIKFNNNLN